MALEMRAIKQVGVRVSVILPLLMSCVAVAAPPPATAGQQEKLDPDVFCFAATSYLGVIVKRAGESPEGNQLLQDVHRALNYYAGRISVRFPKERQGAMIKSAIDYFLSKKPSATKSEVSGCLERYEREYREVVEAIPGNSASR